MIYPGGSCSSYSSTHALEAIPDPAPSPSLDYDVGTDSITGLTHARFSGRDWVRNGKALQSPLARHYKS